MMSNQTALVASANRYLIDKYSGKEVVPFASHVNQTLSAAGLDIQFQSDSHIALKAYSDIVDFKTLFANVLNNILIEKWSATTETWRVWVNTYSLSDFRRTLITAAGVVDEPELIIPGQEYTFKNEVLAEQIYAQLQTYGNLINIQRHTLIEDNISSFQSFISSIVQAYDRQIGDKIYSLLIDNPVTFGDQPIFSSANNNLIQNSGSFSFNEQEFSNTLQLISSQSYSVSTVSSREANLRIKPGYVIVPPEITSQASRIVADYNEAIIEGQKIAVISESRLSGTQSWYLICDNAFTSIGLFTLQDLQVPQIQTMTSFTTDGIQTKHSFDYDVRAIDYRGMVKVEKV